MEQRSKITREDAEHLHKHISNESATNAPCCRCNNETNVKITLSQRNGSVVGKARSCEKCSGYLSHVCALWFSHHEVSFCR